MSLSLAGKPVTVTGGAGFIGSHIVARLLAEGARVTVVDDLRGHARPPAGATLVQSSLDPASLGAALGGAEFVFHCAGNAYVPPSVENPLEDFEQNLAVSLRLLDWLRQHSPGTRTILFSSAAVYGNPLTLPVAEDHPLEPISPYGVSKLAAERYGSVFAGLYRMPVASLRCFSVYGPGQHKQVVFDLMTRCLDGEGRFSVLGDGGQVRDFTYVDDVAAAALAVATRGRLQGEAYNVGSGHGVTIGELALASARALGFDGDPSFTGSIRPGDAERWVADVGRLHSLGWEAATSLEQGLAATAAWVRASRRPPQNSTPAAR
ncbi:MAG: NAD-dependent epimerase/dehydratase family protein [Candidatus Dormibacteria bacterium]